MQKRTATRRRGISIADERECARVCRLCVAKQMSDDSCSEEPSLWIIGGQEFDDAEPVLLILPVRLETVFVLRSQDREIRIV